MTSDDPSGPVPPCCRQPAGAAGELCWREVLRCAWDGSLPGEPQLELLLDRVEGRR